jgi:polyphenol oxidase
MIKKEKNGLVYYQFNLFLQFPIKHAIFTRFGGISNAPFDSLNIGGNLGDLDENIIENKKLIFNVLDIPFETQFDVWQVHGVNIVIPEKPREPLGKYIQADGIVTNERNYTMVMRFADCVPILLYDPINHVGSTVHAGWQGTVKNTVSYAIQKMIDVFDVKAPNIVAGIGPSIGPDHYIVGDNVIKAVKERFPNDWQKMIELKKGNAYFNLWKANVQNLNECGVEQIEIAEMCTACNTNEWYSHREENGKTGRFAAVLQLQ